MSKEYLAFLQKEEKLEMIRNSKSRFVFSEQKIVNNHLKQPLVGVENSVDVHMKYALKKSIK